MMACMGLRPTIKSYTREFSGSKSVIDNIFTDIETEFCCSSVLVSALSDHHAQRMSVHGLLTHVNEPPKFIIKRKFSYDNIERFRVLLKQSIMA